jgi:molybdopterin/thiamine biosynthesis adenylyltransferase
VEKINSSVTVETFTERFTKENADDILCNAGAVVDCVDNIPTRLLLQEAAAKAGIPLVGAAVAGFSGYVISIMPGDAGWKALYRGDDIPEKGIETKLGNPAPTPALAAALQAREVVKVITNTGEPIRNSFFFFDTESNTFEIIDTN